MGYEKIRFFTLDIDFSDEITIVEKNIPLEEFFDWLCPFCFSKKIIRKNTSQRTILDLGTPLEKVLVYVPAINFLCNDCGYAFSPTHPNYPPKYEYSLAIIKYVLLRFNTRNDSGNIIADDLRVLHNVEVPTGTVYTWIELYSKEFMKTRIQINLDNLMTNCKAITIDGTFASIGRNIIGKKEVCGLVFCNQLAQQPILVDIVKQETLETATQALTYLKVQKHVNPELITMDFAPTLTGAAEKVYGKDKVQIDGYHVMQEINRWIQRYILDYKDRFYQKEINLLLTLRNMVSIIQKTHVNTPLRTDTLIQSQKMLLSFGESHDNYVRLTSECLRLLTIQNEGLFLSEYFQLKNSSETSHVPSFRALFCALDAVLPKGLLSQKGLSRVHEHILKQLKAA